MNSAENDLLLLHYNLPHLIFNRTEETFINGFFSTFKTVGTSTVEHSL